MAIKTIGEIHNKIMDIKRTKELHEKTVAFALITNGEHLIPKIIEEYKTLEIVLENLLMIEVEVPFDEQED